MYALYQALEGFEMSDALTYVADSFKQGACLCVSVCVCVCLCVGCVSEGCLFVGCVGRVGQNARRTSPAFGGMGAYVVCVRAQTHTLASKT